MNLLPEVYHVHQSSTDLNFEPKKLSERVSKSSTDPKNFELGERNNKSQER
jgi:hypothetical protein